jgi:UDP-GlcNAc:undecaprenyl-phosphate GlcNAc-1-phosphate transferase
LSDPVTVGGAFLSALAISAAATPVAIGAARRTGFYDHPAGYKKHGASTPYLGGIAVVAGFLLAAAIFGDGFDRFAALSICAIGLLVVGTVDDRIGLGVTIRVLAQLAAAVVLWEAGFAWNVLDSQVADFALTVVWVVGLTNAFNLFDNSDGAAGAIAAASSLGVAGVALVQDDVALAALAIAIAGSCAGFLPYNLARPSRIFLGDGGSMPLGVLVAATIMTLPEGGLGWTALPAYTLLAALPILDTTLVVFSRWRHGTGILDGARDHLTHRLLQLLGSERQVAAALAGLQLAFGAAAVGLSQSTDAAIVVAVLATIVAGAYAIRVLEGPRWMPQARARERARSRRLLVGEEGSV